MQTSRASTRRAALAAFLLFAAALFVVGPADASRTTDARSSLAPSSSRELASLELSLLEPLVPADSSRRFGFAEDLGLIDVEARPCGFELFGGVGTRRCELTYARNNPLKYVDPDGNAAETFVDVAMAAISIKQAVSSPTFWNIAGAVLDVGAVLVPFAPAVGGRLIDAFQAGDKVADAIRGGDRVADAGRAASDGASTVGAMQRLDFVPSPKHGAEARGLASAGPKNGQEVLDYSTRVKDTSTARVGVDAKNKEFVVFRQTQGNQYHGYVVEWKKLPDEMKNALVRSGQADRSGRILER